MVLYSNAASVQARFGQYASLAEFESAVDQLPYERGRTRIDKALDLAASDVFPEARPGVARIALLITDGKQTEASDAKGLREALRSLAESRRSCHGPGRWLRGGRRPTKVDNRD